jgi:hypothetical protein
MDEGFITASAGRSFLNRDVITENEIGRTADHISFSGKFRMSGH